MNSVSVNLHGYYSKLVNLHNYIQTDVGYFQAKLYKFYTFFYYTQIDVNALRERKLCKKNLNIKVDNLNAKFCTTFSPLIF